MLCAYLIDGESNGIERTKINGKMGIRGSDTAIINFDETFVPANHRLGKLGSGLEVFLAGLGACSVDWQVRLWAPKQSFWDVHQEAIRAIKHEMDAAGIGIPFPQMDVHLDRPEAGTTHEPT